MKRFIAMFGLTVLLAACSHQINVSDLEEDLKDEPAQVEETSMPVPGSKAEEMIVTEAIGPVFDSEGAQTRGEGSGPEREKTEPAAKMKARSVMVHSVNWAFEPATITVKQGEDVTLHLMGIEGNHGLAIPGLGVNQTMSEGENAMVKIPTDKPGTYEFFCNVSCGQGHKDMKGTIVIK